MDTVAIPLGQHFREVVLQLLRGGFLGIDGGFLALSHGLEILQDVHQGDVVGLSEHSDVCQRRDTVGGEGGHTAMGGIEGLDDEVVLATGNEFVKSGLAGDG